MGRNKCMCVRASVRVCVRVWCEVRVMGRVEESGGVLISCPGEIVVRKEVAFIMLYKI